MNLTILTTSIGLAAAVGLAAWRGGASGRGVIAGFVVGAALTGLLLARQRRVLRAAPDRALRTVVEGFLVKLAAILAIVLCFVAFPGVRVAVDLRTFFLALTGSILLVLFAGTYDNARVLRSGRVE